VIFSALLTLFLLGLIVYAWLQQKQFPMVGRTLPLVCLLGIYAAWFPDSTSRAASWVGVGRGVDLMLYVWIMASGLLILVLHLKLVAQQRQLTELTRYVAIAGAQPPPRALASTEAPASPAST
jgi:small membrane protein